MSVTGSRTTGKCRASQGCPAKDVVGPTPGWKSKRVPTYYPSILVSSSRRPDTISEISATIAAKISNDVSFSSLSVKYLQIPPDNPPWTVDARRLSYANLSPCQIYSQQSDVALLSGLCRSKISMIGLAHDIPPKDSCCSPWACLPGRAHDSSLGFPAWWNFPGPGVLSKNVGKAGCLPICYGRPA